MVESSGIRDCGASFCTSRVLYGCAETPGHLQRPVKSGFSVPPKMAKVEIRERAKINSCFTSQEFWLLGKRERRAYPASGSGTSGHPSRDRKEAVNSAQVIFARSHTALLPVHACQK